MESNFFAADISYGPVTFCLDVFGVASILDILDLFVGLTGLVSDPLENPRILGEELRAASAEVGLNDAFAQCSVLLKSRKSGPS